MRIIYIGIDVLDKLLSKVSTGLFAIGRMSKLSDVDTCTYFSLILHKINMQLS